jgi:hypothetical protein
MSKRAKITEVNAYNYGFEGEIKEFIMIDGKVHYYLVNNGKRVLARKDHITIIDQDIFSENGWD